jgi:long-subunit fatty acid transport protein
VKSGGVKMKKFLCFWVYGLMLIYVSSAHAINERAGTSAASFLKIAIGARGVGLGGITSVIPDANAVHHNPALLAVLKRAQVSSTYNHWLQTVRHGCINLAYPTPNFVFGAGIVYLNMGEEEETTERFPRGTGKKFRLEEDIALSVCISKRLNKHLYAGAGLKYIHQRVAEKEAFTYAIDAGLLYSGSLIKVGLAIQNVGKEVKFVKETFPLPTRVKIGIAYTGIKDALFMLETDMFSDQKECGIGVEYKLSEEVWLRSGYNYTEERGGRVRGGFGVVLQGALLDFAFIPEGELGNAYQVTLKLSFY